jgi:hypothetical protein
MLTEHHPYHYRNDTTATTAQSATTTRPPARSFGNTANTRARTIRCLAVSTGSSRACAAGKDKTAIRKMRGMYVKLAAISGDAVNRYVRITGARFHTPWAQANTTDHTRPLAPVAAVSAATGPAAPTAP